ncbi:MAG: hypothetical protein GF333_00320 [Candidatus Omnitrophica bacterium]|nr:hypothetical protein [Candidatus Omnitrophota bacterium]
MTNEERKAVNYALLLLRYRARSEQEIIGRLKKKHYSPSAINTTLEYLREYRLIDDREFVNSFVRNSIGKGWGPKKILLALRKFGVSGSYVRDAMPDPQTETKVLRELIKKKKPYYRKRPQGYEKMARFLYSRGFSYSRIRAELNTLWHQEGPKREHE